MASDEMEWAENVRDCELMDGSVNISASAFDGLLCFTKELIMRKKIESTGNTMSEAEYALGKKRDAIWDKVPDTSFGSVASYDNFELGYKLVQEYDEEI